LQKHVTQETKISISRGCSGRMIISFCLIKVSESHAPIILTNFIGTKNVAPTPVLNIMKILQQVGQRENANKKQNITRSP
jgi:hypothetical protein